MKKILKIGGMHCNSCKSLIENELSELHCVGSISVSLEEERAEIVLEDDCIDTIIQTIRDLGFSAQVQE